jgi:hypothetical protein
LTFNFLIIITIILIFRLSKLLITKKLYILMKLHILLNTLFFFYSSFCRKIRSIHLTITIIPRKFNHRMHLNLMSRNKTLLALRFKRIINYPISRCIFKISINNLLIYYSFLFLWMVIRTLTPPALLLQTLYCTIHILVVLNLLPPMAHIATKPIRAPNLIIIYKIFKLPIIARNRFIIENRWIPAIVLQIMCIYTKRLIMLR